MKRLSMRTRILCVLVLYLIKVGFCQQRYYVVNISQLDQHATDEIKSLLSMKPEVSKRVDDSSIEIMLPDTDWEEVKEVLRNLNATFRILSKAKQCVDCSNDIAVNSRSSLQDDLVSEWIPPRQLNTKLIYENVLYTLHGKKGCAVVVTDGSVDCIIEKADPNAWYFKVINKADKICDDGDTEKGPCFEYTVTIHHLKTPGSSLISENNTLLLSTETSEEFLISHVNGKNHLEIILTKNLTAVKAGTSRSNVYIGKFFEAQFNMEVTRVSSKYNDDDSFALLPRTRVHNNSTATAEIPLEINDVSLISGKAILKELMTSKYVSEMFEGNESVKIYKTEAYSVTYKVPKHSLCNLHHTVLTYLGHFVEIHFTLDIRVKVYDAEGGDPTTGKEEALLDIHSQQYGTEKDKSLVSFIFPNSVEEPASQEPQFVLKLPNLKPFSLWRTETECYAFVSYNRAPCNHGEIPEGYVAEECPVDSRNNAVNFKRMLPTATQLDETSKEHDSEEISPYSESYEFSI